jgi:hypothetical protein
MAGGLDLLIHGHGKSGQASQIGIGVGLCRDDVLGVEEGRALAITSGELAQDIGLTGASGTVGETLVGVGIADKPVQDDVIADLALGCQRIAIECLQS